jgi:S-adenosylmethionine synthetase
MSTYLFTSESVTEGHPDKIADQISDGVLDAMLKDDPWARCACETLVTTGLVFVAGEISTKTYVDIPKLARKILQDIGYDKAEYGFDHQACSVLTAIDEQSADIALGVNEGSGIDRNLGAGDQGMMFGFACQETPELMPMPIMFAHKLCQKLAELRKSGKLAYLRPDGKAQVTIEYEGYKPKRVHTVVVSTQHGPEVSHEQIVADVKEFVIKPVCGDFLDENTIYHINPTGRFVIGGPPGDAGLTGRKIIVDTYGGMGRHGGGCFSGKDATKVDRSGAYLARHIAKNLVAIGLAERVEVQLAYAIGLSEPVSIFVETFGTAKDPNFDFVQFIRANFNLTPAGIIEAFGLRKPIFSRTATYGHFGRQEFPWEQIVVG